MRLLTLFNMILAEYHRVDLDTTLAKTYGILTQVISNRFVGLDVNSSQYHTFLYSLVKVKGAHILGKRYRRAVIHSLFRNNCCFY
jgi:hypothetical protein